MLVTQKNPHPSLSFSLFISPPPLHAHSIRTQLFHHSALLAFTRGVFVSYSTIPSIPSTHIRTHTHTYMSFFNSILRNKSKKKFNFRKMIKGKGFFFRGFGGGRRRLPSPPLLPSTHTKFPSFPNKNTQCN